MVRMRELRLPDLSLTKVIRLNLLPIFRTPQRNEGFLAQGPDLGVGRSGPPLGQRRPALSVALRRRGLGAGTAQLLPFAHTVVPFPEFFGRRAAVQGGGEYGRHEGGDHISKDRVVRIDDGAAEALRREFPNVRVIKMEGCGHDPFEEDVPGFLTVLAKALEGE